MNILKNGTVLSDKGNIIHYGIADFVQKICIEENCFVCGASKDQRIFNDEHIIPKWLLRKYDLYSKFITLPNNKLFRYDRYTIPCCEECNKLLGVKFEHKISEAFSKDYKHLMKYLGNDYPILYIWMALIFLKTHLKDRIFREDFQAQDKISDYYDWQTLHHIHCLVRAICFNIPFELNTLGSILVLPTKESIHFDKFDYADIYYCKTMLIIFDDIAILSVLNDSCACMNILEETIRKIQGPLNPLQIKELIVRFAHCNISILKRPRYFTDIDLENKSISLKANIPEIIEMKVFDKKEYGRMLYGFIDPILDNYKSQNREWERYHLMEGDLSYLFNECGEFNNKSIRFYDEGGNELIE